LNIETKLSSLVDDPDLLVSVAIRFGLRQPVPLADHAWCDSSSAAMSPILVSDELSGLVHQVVTRR
jgi:hypothetical protein